MTNVVREINLYLNSRERNPPSKITRPATICTWALDMPIVLKSPENYFQISVRGFHADAGLVPAPYINNGNSLSDNWVRFHTTNNNRLCNLPTGYWTEQELCNYITEQADDEKGGPGTGGGAALGGKFCVYDAVSGRSLYCPSTAFDPTNVAVDFSATLWKAFGWGVQYGVIETPNGQDGETTYGFPSEQVTSSPYPMSAIRDRTLFVLYNAGPKDSFSVSTSAYRTYDESAGTWPLGASGQLKEKRCIAAISLLPYYRPVAPIEFTAQNLTFTALTASCIDNITLELATENWAVVPLPAADYTIILCIQECTPIAQTQPGIPQPIVLPKKSDEEKQKNDKGGDDNEEYIRQLAQQIKKRRLERAADRVDQSGALAE